MRYIPHLLLLQQPAGPFRPFFSNHLLIYQIHLSLYHLQQQQQQQQQHQQSHDEGWYQHHPLLPHFTGGQLRLFLRSLISPSTTTYPPHTLRGHTLLPGHTPS